MPGPMRTGNTGPNYVSPVGAGLVQGRTDQGVDFSGSGPLYALGDGQITNVYNSGWPGGVFISLNLAGTDRYVYYAEDINPTVRVGQQVKAGDVIGHATGGGSGIEIGWAAPPGNGVSLARSQGESTFPTKWGQNFASLLSGLSNLEALINDAYNYLLGKGDKAAAQNWKSFADNLHKQHPEYGIQQIAAAWGATELGKGIQGGLTGVGGAFTAIDKGASNFGPVYSAITNAPFLGPLVSGFLGAGSFVGDVATAVGSIVQDMSKFMMWISWLFVPAHWLRIGAFIAGILFLGGGIYMFGKAALC